MRGNRMGMLAVLTACGLVSTLHAARDERKVVATLPGDPDAGLPIEVFSEEDALPSALAAVGCESVGGATLGPTSSSVIRGNAFRVTRPSDLNEIMMELSFGSVMTPVNAAVSFSIHRNTAAPGNPPVWQHEWSQSPVIMLVGTGRKFYGSGPITPPTLMAGSDYAVALTWGGVNLQYFRDQLSYPQAYKDGQVLGAIGTTAAAGPPVDPTAQYFFVPFSGGAYSMQLCITPKPGACCMGATCVDGLNQNECLVANGTFAEELIDCVDLGPGGCPLPVGACCLGSLCTSLNGYECDRQGGEWQQGVACAAGGANPCLPQGACCSPNGTCSNSSQITCEMGNGVYQGDGTTCGGIGTACQLGACCRQGLCNYVSRPTCASTGGLWRGAGTNCAGDLCDPTGACCDGTACVGAEAVTESDCLDEYQGDWTSCSSLPAGCGKGACCTPTMGCLPDFEESLCDVIGGTWAEGESCATLNPPCPGTCCWTASNTACTANVTPAQCNGLPSGKFVGYGGTCPTACPGTGGAGSCCMPQTGACYRTNVLACINLGGTFSLGGSCSPNNCAQPGLPGACCLPNGLCVELIASQCAAEGGTFSSAGTPCSLEQCAVGACCPGNGGACINNSTVAACNASSGTYFSGESCSAVTCPAIGACCLPNATCQKITQPNCNALNGIYLGDNVNCLAGTFQCTRRSCCLVDGSCLTTVFSVCQAQMGRFDITSGPCSASNVCGACCNNGTCLVQTELSCLGNHEGEGTTCQNDPQHCALGACCLRDGMCMDSITEFECTGINGQFSAGQSCATVPSVCPALGACCKSSPVCEEITGFACTAEGGTFVGDGTTCATGECTLGACCLPAGGCMETTDSGCVALGGEFASGFACAGFTCTAPGACCINGSCQVLTPFGCAAQGGNFRASGSTCTTGLCTLGACCDRNGGCTDGIASDCTAAGSAFTAGTACVNAPCPAVGACCKEGLNTPCEVLSQATCLQEMGTYAGDGTDCTQSHCVRAACCASGPTCNEYSHLYCTTVFFGFPFPGLTCTPNPCVLGACCTLDGCNPNMPREGDCRGPADEFQFLPGGTCTGFNPPCVPRGACCNGTNCIGEMTETECTMPPAPPGQMYLGDGVSCTGNPCAPVMIVSASPANNTIDARRPHPIDNAGLAEGFDQIDVTFDNDASLLTTADFTITQTGGSGTPPMLVSVTPMSMTVLRLTFAAPINPNAWTTIEHNSSGTRTCLGFLPGDVNGNSTADTGDVPVLSGDLGTPMLPAHAVDINRSGAATSEDLIELMDLLNGADAFSPALGATLPASPCP